MKSSPLRTCDHPDVELGAVLKPGPTTAHALAYSSRHVMLRYTGRPEEMGGAPEEWKPA